MTDRELEKLFKEVDEKEKADKAKKFAETKEKYGRNIEANKKRKERLLKVEKLCLKGIFQKPYMQNFLFHCPECEKELTLHLITKNFALQVIDIGLFHYSFHFECSCGYEYFINKPGEKIFTEVANDYDHRKDRDKKLPRNTKLRKVRFFILERLSAKKISAPRTSLVASYLDWKIGDSSRCPYCKLFGKLITEKYTAEYEKMKKGQAQRIYYACSSCSYEYVA